MVISYQYYRSFCDFLAMLHLLFSDPTVSLYVRLAVVVKRLSQLKCRFSIAGLFASWNGISPLGYLVVELGVVKSDVYHRILRTLFI